MKHMPRRKITVAVTALNAIDSPGPGMAVIRALREARDFETRIIGLSYESLEPGIYMKDMVDKTYQIPYPSAGSDVLLARLKYIHAREKIDVIIPNFDSELLNFIKVSEKLEAIGIHSFLPTAKQLESRDKTSLFHFCQKHTFNTPQDRIVYKASEINKAVDELEHALRLPGWRRERWIRGASRVAQRIAAGSAQYRQDVRPPRDRRQREALIRMLERGAEGSVETAGAPAVRRPNWGRAHGPDRVAALRPLGECARRPVPHRT